MESANEGRPRLEKKDVNGETSIVSKDNRRQPTQVHRSRRQPTQLHSQFSNDVHRQPAQTYRQSPRVLQQSTNDEELEKVSKKMVKFLRHTVDKGGNFHPLDDVLDMLQETFKGKFNGRLEAFRFVLKVVNEVKHSDGRPRFELLESKHIRATESAYSNRRERQTQILLQPNAATDLWQAVWNANEKLNQRVAHRVGDEGVKEVTEEDQDLVRKIRHSILAWVSEPLWAQNVSPNIKVDKQPGVMKRVHLYCGDTVEVRLHLFEDAAETYIHNHRDSFWSVNLAGQYRHKVWTIDTNDRSKVHYRFNRTACPQLQGKPEVADGELKVGLGHDHVAGASYFIHHLTPHTVTPSVGEGCTQVPQPILTIYIKGRAHSVDTMVLSNELRTDWGGLNSPEEEMYDLERLHLLDRIHCLVKQSGVDASDPNPLVKKDTMSVVTDTWEIFD